MDISLLFLTKPLDKQYHCITPVHTTYPPLVGRYAEHSVACLKGYAQSLQMQMIFKSQIPERQIERDAPCDTALIVNKFVQMFILLLNLDSLKIVIIM